MNIFKNTAYLLAFFAIMVISGCSKDDHVGQADTIQGADHTYNISFKGGGAFDGALNDTKLSGTVKNVEDNDDEDDVDFFATATYVSIKDNPDLKRISFTIRDKEVFIKGSLLYNEKTGKTTRFAKAEESAEDYSELSISLTDSDRFEDVLLTMFIPASGQPELADVKLINFLGTMGVASFKLEFQGDFYSLSMPDVIIPVSGEIVVAVPAGF